MLHPDTGLEYLPLLSKIIELEPIIHQVKKVIQTPGKSASVDWKGESTLSVGEESDPNLLVHEVFKKEVATIKSIIDSKDTLSRHYSSDENLFIV